MKETLWRSSEETYIRVLPESIKVHSKRCSLPLQRGVCAFGLEESFEKAAVSVIEHYGFELPLSAVAGVTRQNADRIARSQRQSTRNCSALPALGVEEIVAEADGSFIRIVSTDKNKGGDARKTRKVDYREARLCASAAKGGNRTYYDATFESVDSVATLWAQTAKLAGMSMQSHIHVLADGAVWIDTQRTVAFGDQGELLIDLYHVLEYLGEAAASCSLKTTRWLKTQKKRLKTGRSDKVIAELKKHLEPATEPDELCPVRRAWRYLNNRRDYLAYDQAIKKELPVGSGLIESGNKHVLQARMKIPGASWSINTAENFAKARALRANKLWNQYWEELREVA